ncbi:MAG: TAXI family TRAP transporter solute-binding subunit [Candidatus Rokuibacteriota bacterium]
MGRRPVVLALVLATVAAVAVAFATSPSPPRRIRLATGPSGGMYDSFGQEYHHRLDRLGLQARTLSTNGSRDNLERLLRREVDVAFVQSGVGPLVPNAQERLRALAALYLDPLWVFHRLGPSIDSLSAFSGRRMAVGAPGSGTEAVARALLREHGIDTAVNLSPAEARRELEAGRLDAAFFVTSYRDPSVHALLRRPDIALLSFRREAAYARKVPGLQTVKLPEGVAATLSHARRRRPSCARGGRGLPHPGRVVPVPHRAVLGIRWWGLLKLLVLPLLVWLPLVRILPEISN